MSESIRYENYELLQDADGSPVELGRGAMGVTYKARDTDLRCVVALKVIGPGVLGSADARERFLREARAAAQLRHPNIATVFRLGHAADGTHYYAMEFCDGQTLQQALAAWGPLPASTAVHLAWQVSKALRVAEQHRLIHRDLKPANLIVTQPSDEGLVIKVIDFGLAKSFADGASSLASSVHGFAGTAHYASPEQIKETDLDIRSDIYSLGACLWFMLTGHPPFEGPPGPVMSQTLSADLPWPKVAGQPACVLALLRRMLAKDRDERHPTAAALRAEMEECLRKIDADIARGETPTVAAPAPATQAASALPPPTPSSRPPPSDPRELPTVPPAPPPLPPPGTAAPPARFPALAAGIALLVLVVGVASFFALGALRDRTPEPTPPPREAPRAAERGPVTDPAPIPDPQPAAASTGSIIVNSVPDKSTIRVDGEDHGKTPKELENVAAGLRRLSIQSEGYEPAELLVEVLRGARSNPGTIHLIALKATPPPAPTPPPTPPARAQPTPRPAPGLSDDDVRTVANAELDATVRGNVPAIVACYSSPVDYYDEGSLTGAQLRRSLESYRRIWPTYQIGERSEILITPTDDPDIKHAVFTYVFVATNKQNGKQSRGLARDEITVRKTGGKALITHCRQTVTDRQKNF